LKAKRAGECDGLSGLPEAARGGPGPAPWSPPAWFTPVRATRAVRRLRGGQGGRRRRAPEPAPPPTRRPPDGPQAPSASPTRAREHPPTAAGVGEGLGEIHTLPGLPPGPAPGHLLHHQRRPSRPATEPRGPPRTAATTLLRRGGGQTAVAGDLQHPWTAGPRSAPRRRTRPPTRAGPTGGLVEGQVTTNWKQALAQLAAAYPDRINPHL